jgi:hypothetical protein
VKKIIGSVIALSAALVATSRADAANLAIFGQNNIGSFYSTAGNAVTYVSDAQIATAGFLNAFDAFVYTRDGYSFGVSLSAAAAANVKSYVTGNVVLFNGDFQDDIGDADTNALFTNALNYVTSSAHGYIGEYRGSFAAFTTDADGDNGIGLVNGTAGVSGAGQGGSDGNVLTAPGQAGNPLLAGVSLPYNPGAVEFGSQLTGYNPAKVVLQFSNGNPALIASGVDVISSPAPEPASWAMMVGGFGMIGGALRSRKRARPLSA